MKPLSNLQTPRILWKPIRLIWVPTLLACLQAEVAHPIGGVLDFVMAATRAFTSEPAGVPKGTNSCFGGL